MFKLVHPSKQFILKSGTLKLISILVNVFNGFFYFTRLPNDTLFDLLIFVVLYLIQNSKRLYFIFLTKVYEQQ